MSDGEDTTCLYDAGKYEVIGVIRNKESKEIVHTDIPIFIMLGSDKNVPQAMSKYFELCNQPNHVMEGYDLIQKFYKWQKENAEKVHEPDSGM